MNIPGFVLAGLLTSAVACGGDDEPPRSPKEIVLERYPECADEISDTNPTVKDGVIQFGCHVEVDGPTYYLDAETGDLICKCSMICDAGCPPPAFR